MNQNELTNYGNSLNLLSPLILYLEAIQLLKMKKEKSLHQSKK